LERYGATRGEGGRRRWERASFIHETVIKQLVMIITGLKSVGPSSSDLGAVIARPWQSLLPLVLLIMVGNALLIVIIEHYRTATDHDAEIGVEGKSIMMINLYYDLLQAMVWW